MNDNLSVETLQTEIRGEEVWVNLNELLLLIIFSSEAFLDIEDTDVSREFKSGFVTGVRGIVEVFSEFGHSKVELSKLNTIEDFMELTK